ncbi:MAG: WbqC family protein, partial [Thermodesulfovibrionales bacterium]
MRIGILQPGYLPWLGFFEQMYRSEVFVLYDDVQYDKEGWRNRNRIKGANGVQWLTVPVHVKLSDRPLIHEVRIDSKSPWRKKHLQALRMNYAKAPFFSRYIGIFEEAYAREWECLVDIDLHFILQLSGCLGLGNRKIVRSSTLNAAGDRIERLVNICRMFGADTFYEGASGRNYLDSDYFAEQGIRIEYQDYRHPVYRQLYGDFVPYLSVVDLLFNHGDESLSILLNQGK